jgi:hypothetical protein
VPKSYDTTNLFCAGHSYLAGSGTTAVDSSDSRIAGTLSGTSWTTAGKYGNALSFNGNTSYVNLGNPAVLAVTGSMTWTAWVHATGTPSDDGQIIARSKSDFKRNAVSSVVLERRRSGPCFRLNR